jgi:hypothetical protein
MPQFTHPIEIAKSLTAQSADSSFGSIAEAFIDVAADYAVVIAGLASAGATGWTAANQASLNTLLNSAAYQKLQPYLSNYGSIALVVGGDAGVILSGKSYYGIIYEPNNPDKPQFYESGGLSIGGTEGAVAFTGIVMNSEDIHHAGGVEFFFSVQLDLGAGVAGEVFHDLGKNKGSLILVSSGEEIDVSGGIGYAKTKHLKGS